MVIGLLIMKPKREGRVTYMARVERENVDKELLELIRDVMPEIDSSAGIDFNKDMVSEYGVNSISIIRLIVAVESRFGTPFTDYELALEGYHSFSDMAQLICRKLEDQE